MFPLAEKLARRIGVAASSASIAVAAISPAQAAAPTWIKATFAGTATDNSAGTVVTSFTDWTFYIYNYALDSTSTSSYASATQPSTVQGNSVGYNPPLFGFGSFTGNGFTGQYNAYGAPDTSQPPSPTGYDRIVFDQNASRQIRFNTGRLNTSSGIKFTNSNKTYDVNFIAFSGQFFGYTPTGGSYTPFTPNSGETVISNLIANSMSGTTQTFSCTGTCNGQLSAPENTLSLTWTSVTFEAIQGVPGPLPIAGILMGLKTSRQLRKRVKSTPKP